MRHTRIIVCVALAALSGCQQLAWKPGADAAALQRDTAACRADTATAAAVQQCLTRRGWSVRQTAPDAAPLTGGAPLSTDTLISGHKTVPPAAGVVDPLALKTIQSWWKPGAQSADLAADQAVCADKLGAAHRPDLKNRLYTQAMIGCLIAQGWSGR